MAKHRDFDIKRFVTAVSTEDLQRFFDALGVELSDGWPLVNGDALDAWLREPEQAEIEPSAREQMRRINDLGSKASGALIAACEKFEISLDPTESLEALALRLFVSAPPAFGYAWSRYLLYTNVESLAEYYFPAGRISVDTERISALKEGLRELFASQRKGRQLRIDPYEDGDELITVVQRGHYSRTLPLFADESDEISYRNFRPVVDDLLVYDPVTQILRIKASSDLERRAYLWQFSQHVAGRPDLYAAALSERVFTLEPLQSGRFSFSGSGDVLAVRLVRASIQLGPHEYAEYRSPDLVATFAARPDGVSLQSGPLLAASFVFSFSRPRKAVSVRCDVRPPSRGKIPDNQYGVQIDAYLREQGIKLR